MKKTNKKGFTLVELLAVIVILAIVMLIAVTSIGPVMSKAEKGAIVDEGLGLISAGELAYQAERLDSSSAISATKSACFDIRWLYQNGYYKKGTEADGYVGSVLLEYNSTTKKYSYEFWISDGKTYTIKNGTSETNNDDVSVYDKDADKDGGLLTTCGEAKSTNTVYCIGTADCVLGS